MKFDLSKMEQGFERLAIRTDASVRVLAEQGATKMQNSAKANAKWETRTGQAKRNLKGDVATTLYGYRIILSHGVNYGIWLELANNKKYAIIPQTIRYVGTFEIMPAFNRLMEKL